MNYVELIINSPANAKLDLDSDVNIGLQYSIADIRDISKRNAAYSKTIKLPGTKSNNFWFGNLFDVNSDFTSFNPNRKTDCKLLVNSETVINGFLQLRKINKLANVNQNGNQIEYEVVIFNNAVDLMTELGEKTVNELNLIEYGHTFSISSITQSWDHTYVDGYVYPMYGTEQTPNAYSVDNFWPGMFYWTLLDRTLWEAGFGWTGSLKTNEQFQNEIIAYVSDGRPKISEEERRRREFRAGFSQSYTQTIGTFSANSVASQAIPSFGWTSSQLNDDFTLPNFDNDDNWDVTTYEWELDRNGLFSGEWRLSGTFSLYNGSGTTVSAVMPSLASTTNDSRFIRYRIDARPVIKRNNLTLATIWPGSGVDSEVGAYTFHSSNGNAVLSKTFSVAESRDVFPFNLSGVLPALTDTNALSIGDKVYLQVQIVRYQEAIGLNSTPSTRSTYQTYWNGQLQGRLIFNTDSYFKNTAITSELTQGDYIQLGDYLPDKIKQKDLVTDLIKRYNLYITIDPDNDRMLIMDSRPDYYNSGDVLDWTLKKDYSSEDNIELLSELQFKEMMFSYKPDNDIYNTSYTSATGDIYGQQTYIFDNDFVKGVSKIESPFSPTPLIWNENVEAHLPAIDPVAPKIQPRILYWGGLKPCGNNFTIAYQNITTGLPGTFNNNTIGTTYPYAGHFDDPIEPQLDINFGINKYYFYNNYEYVTNNNMYNTYWANYINQIEEGRLVTSKFALNEYDIRYIKENFNSKIFVDGAYYYVNKIIDYNPLKNDVTTVELIKIVEGLTWEGQPVGAGIGLTAIGPVKPTVDRPFRPFRPERPIRDWGFRNNIGFGGIVIGDENSGGGFYYVSNANDDDPSATQSYVFKYPNRQFILGSGNTLSYDSSAVFMGDNNTIEGENVLLFGVSGLTVSDSNIVYFGPSFSINLETGTFISGGSTISISGTAGYIPKFSDTSTLVNSGFFDVSDIGGYVTSGGTVSLYITSKQILVRDGDLDNPSISFQNDMNTGFYRYNTDKIGVAVGGALTANFNTKGLEMVDDGQHTVYGIKTASAVSEAVRYSQFEYETSKSYKSGYVVAGSFSGTSSLYYAVTFSVAYDAVIDDNYSISVLGEDSRAWSFTNKSKQGFTIQSNSSTALTGEVLWITQKYNDI